ncbi:hypothetical protein [Syntrophotalea acetylenica]|uniref:hypothetical protein n=1 Tax=Syntrophotalea acetylenica TaxID=29542 RepID=UPI002A36C4E1|nr:hypothetical protein [Syntrophotalea acetylenica]MDY0261387.1 hypothetical protein [Syntrophotalea acetylenica]
MAKANLPLVSRRTTFDGFPCCIYIADKNYLLDPSRNSRIDQYLVQKFTFPHWGDHRLNWLPWDL